MSRYVAIVGSRKWPGRLRDVHDAIAALPPDVVIVSGGAHGIDRMAEVYARALRREVRIICAAWKQYGNAAGAIRNTEIVRLADEVVAFWDGESRGTADTISKAVAAGKPTTVIYPDGRREEFASSG